MRILGIDPGSRFTGIGIIEVDGDRVTSVHHGVIKTGGGEFPQRLGIIFSEMLELIEEYAPDAADPASALHAADPTTNTKLRIPDWGGGGGLA